MPVPGAVPAEVEKVDLLAYFPMEQGYSWSYLLPQIGKTTSVRVDRAQPILGGKATRVLVAEDNSSQALYNVATGHGIYLVSEYVATQGWSIVPTEPMRIVPAFIEERAPHAKSSPCTRRSPLNEPLDQGTLSVASALEKIEDVSLQVGHFERCALWASKISYTSDSGQLFVVDSKMWLAKGIGAIKAVHAYIFEAFNEFEGHKWEVTLELQEARLGDKAIP